MPTFSISGSFAVGAGESLAATGQLASIAMIQDVAQEPRVRVEPAGQPACRRRPRAVRWIRTQGQSWRSAGRYTRFAATSWSTALVRVGRQHGVVGGLAHAMAGALRQPRWRLGCPGLARPGRTALLADIVPASFYRPRLRFQRATLGLACRPVRPRPPPPPNPPQPPPFGSPVGRARQRRRGAAWPLQRA